jgi:hypothetical protein
MGGNFCYECAFKHLAETRVLLHEMLHGWNDTRHLALAVGNLAQAERHLALHPDLVDRVRGFRRTTVGGRFGDVWASLTWADETVVAEMFDALDGFLDETLKLERSAGALPPEPDEHDNVTALGELNRRAHAENR